MKSVRASIFSIFLTIITLFAIETNVVNCWASTNCVAPPSGLVAWWSGEGNTLDRAGTNTGVLLGNASYGTGEVGQGFSLDGMGTSGIKVNNATNLQIQNLTIEAWVRRSSASVV